MTYFLKSGNKFRVSAKESMDLREELPVGTYTIKYDQMAMQYYIEMIDDFEIKGKVYGDTLKTTKRILDTFEDRTTSTGVLLSGEKGSGKTLQAKLLASKGAERGVPTIVINQPHAGEEFNSFIQMIEQPTIIIFDEFEKVYDQDEQTKMLTLLDGVYPSKKLFVLTSNDKWRINEHMRNRPGRIYYRLDYTGLENDFIVEYCQDNLNNKTFIESVCRVGMMFSQFNFDILKAMVEEMNRYNEAPQDVLKMLNAKPESSDSASYDVALYVDGTRVPEDRLDEDSWRGNALSQMIRLDYLAEASDSDTDDEDDADWQRATFDNSNLKAIDPASGKYEFENQNLRLVLVKKREAQTYHWDAI